MPCSFFRLPCWSPRSEKRKKERRSWWHGKKGGAQHPSRPRGSRCCAWERGWQTDQDSTRIPSISAKAKKSPDYHAERGKRSPRSVLLLPFAWVLRGLCCGWSEKGAGVFSRGGDVDVHAYQQREITLLYRTLLRTLLTSPLGWRTSPLSICILTTNQSLIVHDTDIDVITVLTLNH